MDEHATGRRIVIQPPDDEGFNPITIQSSPRDGSVQLRQADWMGNASVVCFEPRQAEQVIASIREHATGEGMREATSRENPVIARLQRELKAQREGMGREIGRLAEENERLRKALLAAANFMGLAERRAVESAEWREKFRHSIADAIEATQPRPVDRLPDPGPDGEGSDTD